MNRRPPANDGPARIAAWWDAVLAGDVDTPHPLYGDQVKVKLADDRLILSGEIDRRRDRDEFVRQARGRIGRGVRKVDSSALKVRPRRETPGILEQTLAATFAHRDTADVALKYMREHSEVALRDVRIVERSAELDAAMPEDVIEDARKQLARGQVLLVVKVDETDAYRIRSLLEEDMRSMWTVAAPPHLITGRK